MPFNLTPVNATYNATSKFGQSLNGGYAYTTTPPVSGYPYTLRATVKINASSQVEVAAGQAGFGWIGKSATNTVLAHYGFGTDVELAAPGSLADGQYHEIELCVSATGGQLFVDGTLVASSATATTPVTTRYFGARAFFNTAASAAATFPWTGEIDQVALFNTVQHSAAYTPSTTALTGSEPNLVALYGFNGNTNDTASVPAPTLSISAPSTSTVGSPITVTVSTSGTSAATSVNLTATDGTYNPTSVSVPTNGSATSSYTPASAGTKTLTATDAAGVLAPASTTTVASAAAATGVQIAHNNAGVFYSPSNWDDRGTFMSSANPGSYARLAFSGSSVAVKVDVSAMVAANLPAASYPIVRTVIDNVFFVDTQLTSAGNPITRTGLASGTHTLEVFFLAADINNGDRWVTPVNAVRLAGFTLADGASLSTVAKRSKTALFFGDSIWEGYLAAGTVTTQPVGNNALLTTVPAIAKAFDAEYGTIAFSGQGYQVAGNNGAVAFPSAYASYSSGRSRLVNGLFSPAPDYIFVQHGTNGTTTQANVQAMIVNLRAAAPNARIFMIVPANGSARTQITAAVNAIASPTVSLIDIGTGYAAGIGAFGGGANLYSLDGLHPNPLSNAQVGAADIRAIQTALGGTLPTNPIGTFARSKSRTIKALAAPNLFATATFFGNNARQPTGTIDPNATVDVTFDWGDFLTDIEDTIAQVQFDIDGLTSVAAYNDTTTATIFVKEANGDPRITCRVTTASNPPRVEDRTIYLKLEQH